ncbi:MAG: hypothetical protein LUQ55_00755 [Methanomassiliicoccales archaeon]|nr:hypothetical protein [Methanomassiliicoccales archaeon]
MRAAVLLDLDEIVFLEPSFDRLLDDVYTSMLACLTATEGRVLVNEKEDPMAVALKDREVWKACSFTLRNPTDDLFDKLEQIDVEVFQEKQDEWAAAVREYYSLRLMKETPPSVEDFSADRARRLRELTRVMWRGERKGVCLDACCGSGIGSLILRSIGMSPLAFDNDPSLLSRGLMTGRLLPEETMWIDASKATRYMKPVGHGLLLMAGEISSFNSVLWKVVVRQVLGIADRTIITTGTEKEARLLEGWCIEEGREVRRFENTRDPFYDRWVCDVMQK